MSTLVQYKHDSNPVSLVETESEKPISSRITALDMVGLTWIFKTEEELLAEFR
ncbi:MAG: hypothetical protein ACW9XH_09240 [Candidatus Nitrosopumilus sp. bin_32a]